jgi:hypothetical protein
MWKYVTLLIIIIIFLLAFFIVLGLVTHFSKVKPGTVNPSAQIEPTLSPNVWGDTSNVTPCGLYQFTGGIITVDNVQYQYPPAPTYSFNYISPITPTYTLPSCLDQDQLLAQEINRTCLGATGAVSGCYLEDGNLATPGTVNNYFTTAYCTPIPSCVGTLSLISVGFEANPTTDSCFIKSNTSIDYTPAGGCNIGDENQIFRVILSTSTSQQNTVIMTGSNNVGPLAQFYDRDTGLCVLPNSNTVNSALSLSSCPSPQPWLLVPTFTFAGSTGFTGYVGYDGGPGYTGNISAPQQIAYVADIDTALLPPFGTLTFAEFIVQQEILSIYNNFTSGAPFMGPYYFFPDIITDNGQTDAQYFSIMNYNSLNQVQLCSSTQTSDCSSF